MGFHVSPINYFIRNIIIIIWMQGKNERACATSRSCTILDHLILPIITCHIIINLNSVEINKFA